VTTVPVNERSPARDIVCTLDLAVMHRNRVRR
jgi:hypothetical protein